MAQPLARRMTTKEMLARLVSFDTTSRNSNLPLIEFIRVYCQKHDGSGPGRIAQAHQPDEYVAQSELDSGDAFIRRLTERRLVKA